MSDHAHPDATNPDSSSATNVDHEEDIQEHIRTYVLVFVALAVLTGLTVAVAYIEFSMVLAVIIGLTIATVKGGLVAGYFMHLVTEEKVIYVVLAFTVAFFLAMLILMFSSLQVHRAVVA